MSSSTNHRQPPAIGALAAILAVPLAVAVAAIARPAVAHANPAGAQSPQSAASAQAEATGEPVTIDADTTAYSTTVANPDGSYTWTASLQPLHASKDGQWVTPDSTLQHNSDGTISPVAAASTLILSGGGDGPLATFDDGQGHHLSATLPMPLPTPTLNANTATYSSVLPGVDLVVTADTRGGMSDVFVVHNATAATNPALTSIELGLTGDNLVVATDPNGAISANDPTTETPAFAAPPPLMWDSTTPQTAGLQQTATTTADPADTPPTTSSVDGPGVDAHVTPVPVQPGSDAVTLTPPADALTGDTVTYPLYIDPQIDPATNPEAYVQSNHPSTTAYNPSDNLRTGYSDWDDGSGWLPGVTRTFLRYDGLGALAGKDIREAHLQLTEVSSSDHSTSNFYSVAVSDTDNWGSNLDWANQPGYGAVEDDAAIPGVPSGQTSDYQITVTDMVQYGVGKGWTGMNMVMHAGDEQNDMKYKHWALHPKLVVTYWSTPDQPQGLKEINGGQSTSCAASPGPWIPAAANNKIDLHYTVSTVDTNTPLAANTWVSDNGAPVKEYSKAFTYSSGNYPIDQDLTVTDGHSYGWYAQTNNPYVWSKISATCYFRYDSTPPTAPAITSTAYPANGPTTVTADGSGTVTLSADDPLPQSGDQRSGVTHFNYNINGTSINSGGGGEKQATASPCTPTPCNGYQASLSIPLSALHWGTNTLWAQTVDSAGNVSQPVHYDFYVQQSAFGAYTPGTAGDIDGDNIPDLVTVDAAGNLRLFTNPEAVSVNPTGNTTDDPLQYGGRILISYDQAPLWHAGTFSGALVAHAGSFTGHNADDLVLVQHGLLGIAENTNGNASAWQIKADVPKPACPDCTNYDSGDWSSVTQLIAVPNNPGSPPSIITVEFYNGIINLLLYTPQTSGERFNPPTLLSTDTSGVRWEDLQLLSAAPLPGLPGDTLIMRNVGNNNLETANDITNLRGQPVLHVLAAGMFPTSTYQQVATFGRADADGNWPVWAANANGSLDLFRATTSNGTTTWADSGAPRPISDERWSGHELSLSATFASYNNSAFVVDGYQTPASFDGNGRAYSAQDMSHATLGAGVTSSCPLTDQAANPPCTATVSGGQQLSTDNGDTFVLAPTTPNNVDNWTAAGQTLPVPVVNFSVNNPTLFAQNIAFLGAATNSDGSPASDIATVTFTDGHTQQIPITLSDWTLNNNHNTPATGNTIAATGTYLDNTTTGTQTTTPTYLFTTQDTALKDNDQSLDKVHQQITSITLPKNGAMHIFAISVS